MTVADLPKLAEPLRTFFAEAGLPGVFNPEHCLQAWTGLLASGVGILGWDANEQGNYRGGVGGVLSPDINTGDLVAQEMFWYVMPGQRKGGLKLLDWFEHTARARGAVRIAMIHMEGANARQLSEFYQRRGYTPLERAYLKTL